MPSNTGTDCAFKTAFGMMMHYFMVVDVKKKTHARETVGLEFTPFRRPQEAIDERLNAAPGANN